MNGSPVRARRTDAPTCCVRERACACGIGRPRIPADTCEHVPSVWTAGGLARRRSTRRQGSTRTSARGTPPRSPTWERYAPKPFGAPPQAGQPRRVVDAARAVVRGGAADGRACACADVWARACVGVHVCRYSCAYERRDTCMYLCICLYVCIIHIYIYMYIGICVLV
jgi:hypothetical protein